MMQGMSDAALQRFGPAEEGAPVVFALHSLGLRGESWTDVAMSAGADLYTFDQCGHGAQAARSPKSLAALIADAEAMLNKVPGDRVHLLGHSMGGCIAAHLATSDTTGRVVSLAIVASPLKGSPAFRDRATAVADGNLDSAIATTLQRWFGPDGQVNHPDAWNTAAAALQQMQPEGFDASWHALAEFAGFAALTKITVPVVVCSFPDDLSTPPQNGEAIVEALRARGTSAAHHLCPAGGHMGPLSDAQDLAALLSKHWSRADAPSSMEAVR